MFCFPGSPIKDYPYLVSTMDIDNCQFYQHFLNTHVHTQHGAMYNGNHPICQNGLLTDLAKSRSQNKQNAKLKAKTLTIPLGKPAQCKFRSLCLSCSISSLSLSFHLLRIFSASALIKCDRLQRHAKTPYGWLPVAVMPLQPFSCQIQQRDKIWKVEQFCLIN